MTSSTVSRQGAAAEGIFIGLLVRNTFIDDVFWDVEATIPSGRKRHNSAPPRTSSSAHSTHEVKLDPCHSEDESTQGGNDSSISDGQSSDAGLQEDAESVANESGNELPVQARSRWSDDVCVDCSVTQSAAPVQAADEQLRTSLKSSAKAWAPAPAMITDIQLESVVCAAKANLTLAGFGPAVRVSRSSDNITITACIGQERKEHFLGVAQNALLMASQTVDHIYLLGYRAEPFVPDAMGFSATFGEMGDPQMACWDLYQHGWCKHNWRCRWHHPTWMRQVSVKVV